MRVLSNGSQERESLSGRRHSLGTLPLVGRRAELEALTRALDAAERGAPSTIFLAGEGGIGKTRLAGALVAEATRRRWMAVTGRAYPVESGVPYALFSDALLPALRALDAAALSVLSRGGEAELARLFPALGLRVESRGRDEMTSDVKARVLWNFAQFLGRLAARTPTLIVLENLQWADASSLELLHFTARQLGSHRLLLLCSYNDSERAATTTLARTERSLVGLGVAHTVQLAPLTRADSDALLAAVFEADPAVTRTFAALLYERTRGNPFFTEEMLKALVDSGRLRREGGRWVGWDVGELDLPHTVRDAIIARLERLSTGARAVADVAAVLGSRTSYPVLQAVSELPERELVDAIDELRRDRVLADGPSVDDEIHYDFTHPTLQATLYSELGRAKTRLMHGRIAMALERLYGALADAHADELAFHFARAAGEATPKAARYLGAAGRAALAKYATREAAAYLEAALEIHDREHAADNDTAIAARAADLVEDLARAKQRLGEYDAALELWARARAEAESLGETARLAAIEQRL
ncbi:MAG TPA: AAA family ATPase, partial [Gemmatimonadaceae bacterium]|nr:AAA family ATPase [Gemmatimonadaceae bacterium]